MDFVTPIVELQRSTLEERMNGVREKCPAARSILKVGTAWKEILAAAAEARADVIVLGTHGRRGIGRVMSGITTATRSCEATHSRSGRPPIGARTAARNAAASSGRPGTNLGSMTRTRSEAISTSSPSRPYCRCTLIARLAWRDVARRLRRRRDSVTPGMMVHVAPSTRQHAGGQDPAAWPEHPMFADASEP